MAHAVRTKCLKTYTHVRRLHPRGEQSGGGGSNNKKDHAAGKNPRFLLSFCSFSKHVQNRRFCAEFGQKCVLKKRTKKIKIFVFFDLFCFFFVLFCCFCRIWLTKFPQIENKKDHAAGKIARCPLSFLLLDPPPPPPKRDPASPQCVPCK